MRKYFAFAVIVIPVFLGHVGSSAIAVAFPTIVSHFQTSLVLAGWILSVYQLVAIGAIPIIARFSDAVGRRSTFAFCLILFTIGSFLCAIAPNIGLLILFRVIQAVGGGGFMSAAIGTISDEFPEVRHRLIGLVVSIATFGAVAGPNIGGILVQYMGWQSVFWLNAPIGITALVLARYFIKADARKASHPDMDFPGAALLTGSVSAVMISLTLMSKAYQTPLVFIVFIALLGVVLFVTFIYRTKRRGGGVFSLQMITGRPFLAANVFNFVFGTCGENGIMSLMPLYATSIYGMSTLQSGLMVTPRSIGVVVASVIASFSLTKWGYRRPIVLGSLIIAAGLVLLGLEPGAMTIIGISLSPVLLVVLLGAVVGIGAGLANPAANNACIELMPDKAASITGLRQVSRRMGQTIGIALSTLVLETSTSMARGFTVLLIGFSVAMLVAIVAAFSMPASPKC